MIRLAFAALLLLHGLVHALRFLVPWQITTSPDFPYTTSAAWAALEPGDAGARAVGIVMLGLAAAFPVAAFAVWRRRPWGVPIAVACGAISLGACILQSPAAVLGVTLDSAILAGVGLVRIGGLRLEVAGRR
jgi:hypothetical protein